MKILIVILASIVILIIIFLVIGRRAMNNRLERELIEFLAESGEAPQDVIKQEDLAGLPEPVMRYFEYANVVGSKKPGVVRLSHGGRFRPGEGRGWMDIEGYEYFTTEPPGFFWHGEISILPLVSIRARDRYFRGKGNMLIFLSAIILSDAAGREMDISSLLRYLSEAPLFPQALLPSENLKWEAVDSNSAKATLKDRGLEVSGVFHFSDSGEIIRFTTDERYRAAGVEQVRERWTVRFGKYKDLNGVMAPMRAEASWNMSTGDLSYADFLINEMEYRK